MGRVWKGGWWVARAPYHRISWFTTLEDCHKIDFLQVLNLLMKGSTGCQTYYVQKLPLLSSRSLIRQFEKPHSKELQQWLSSFTHVVVSGRSSTGWEDDSYKVPICWQLSLWSQNIQGCWPHQPIHCQHGRASISSGHLNQEAARRFTTDAVWVLIRSSTLGKICRKDSTTHSNVVQTVLLFSLSVAQFSLAQLWSVN